ncbi:DUF1802 family protein [Anatilimnocola floriformis]|uniref:DUF1802 family protein n=1 Tax=Anatilimnocola floriformis TaxID=2948575 RepID=UPI0020C25847|nr:DUF1802 family protein [Anatilimnocola floriformis]
MQQNSIALKEWAVICRALETGRQTLLLRKGGIAEGPGGFRAEHERFWLYPTQFHQGAEQLQPEFAPLLGDVGQLQGANGQIVVRAFAEVKRVEYLTSLKQVLALSGLHGWTDDVVRQRFDYKRPGLYLFVLRIFLARQATLVTESVTMAGCKSWVELPQPIATSDLQPVLDEVEFQVATANIDAASRLS